MPDSYNYNVKPTTLPLTFNELYEGRLVCFNDVDTNPNNVGTLEPSKNVPGAVGRWTSLINGVRYCFDANGAIVNDNITEATTPILYGVEYNDPIIPEQSGTRSRPTTDERKSDVVSLKTMTPKDYFACHALTAIIQRTDKPLSIDDGTIALIAAKCYKIAQAMAIEAYESRENNDASSIETETDYIDIDGDTLTNDTDRLLYNINESIKENTRAVKEEGVIIRTTEDTGPISIATTEPIETEVSNIDKVKFDGIPSININNTPSVNVANTPSVNINNTPNVSVSNTVNTRVTNMPNVPTEPVRISGTVSVDNFPSSSTE